MASLEQRNGRFRVVFRYGGEKHARSLKTAREKAANASLARLEDNLRRLELGTLTVPDDADLGTFLLSDGRQNGKPKTAKIRFLPELLDTFLAQIPASSIEDSSRRLLETHVRHLKKVFGARLPVSGVHFSSLQRYVDQRSADRGLRGRPLSPQTIEKEMATLRLAWNWARQAGIVSDPLPTRGLRYPKTREKPPFQTWAEIERQNCPRRNIGRRTGRSLGLPVPDSAGNRRLTQGRPGESKATVHLPHVRLRRPHRGEAERAARFSLG